MSDDFDIQRDMGLSRKQQIKLWEKIFNVRKPEAKPKVSKKQANLNTYLKLQAIELFRSGKTTKEVAAELDITYANASYYKKFI